MAEVVIRVVESGLVVDTVITGPGRVYLQTMTVAGLAKLLLPFVTDKK